MGINVIPKFIIRLPVLNDDIPADEPISDEFSEVTVTPENGVLFVETGPLGDGVPEFLAQIERHAHGWRVAIPWEGDLDSGVVVEVLKDGVDVFVDGGFLVYRHRR